MASSTTQSIWRSGGGDTTKTAYAGSMLMVADFYFDPTLVNTSRVQKSSTDTGNVILPIGAIITAIQFNAAGTGGSTPTMDMGFTLYNTGTATVDGLLSNYAADAGKQQVVWGASGAGTSVGVVMSATEMVYITGGANTGDAPAGGTVAGRIEYYVPTNGAYTA
jgi:hypothetical protein